jgi:hypothetical protein
MSIWALFCALVIAVVAALAARRGRPVSLRVMMRAMFPRHRLFGASARADLGFTEADRNAFVELGYGWIVVRRTALGPPEGPRARVAIRRLREMLGAPRAEDDAVFVWELPSAGSR